MKKILVLLGIIFLFSLMLVPLASAAVLASDTTSAGTNTYFKIGALHPTNTNEIASANGQSFQPNATEYAANITLYLKKTGTPTGSLTVTLTTMQGTYGTTSVPLTLLEESDALNATLIQGSYLPFVFNFSKTTSLVNSSYYTFYLSCSTTGFSISDYVSVGTSEVGSVGNGFRYMTSAWTAFSTIDIVYVLNGDLAEGEPTPTPTPAPTSSGGGGDADMEALVAAILPWLVPLLICLIPALLGYKFVGELGFFIGLNVGCILAYVTLAGTAYAFPLWGIILVGVMDVAVVLMRR